MAGADQEKRKQALDHFVEHSLEPLNKRLEKQLADNDSGFLIAQCVSTQRPLASSNAAWLSIRPFDVCRLFGQSPLSLKHLTAALSSMSSGTAAERSGLGSIQLLRFCQVSP